MLSRRDRLPPSLVSIAAAWFGVFCNSEAARLLRPDFRVPKKGKATSELPLLVASSIE